MPRTSPRRPAPAFLLAVLALACAAGLIRPAPAVAQDPPPPPSEDPFYQAPSPLPDAEPGTILRSRPVSVRVGRVLPIPVDAWQILYLSTSALGEPNAVSGTVLVPMGEEETSPRPLVTYAVGTHGLGDQCAPSYELRDGSDGESGLIAQALLRGWAVVVTDYEGLGTPGTHTYTAALAEGTAMLDASRAALRLPGAGLDRDAPIGIWGYSQGGQAAAFAGELQPVYAPELDVRGIAAGGVPSDLVEAAKFIDGGPAAGLVLAAGIGQSTAYPDLPFDEILNEAGQAAVAEAKQLCTAELTRRFAFRRINEFTTVPDPLGDPRWLARLEESHAGRRAPGAPVLLYHGTTDEVVPFELGRRLFDDYCALGIPVTWRPLFLHGHIAAGLFGAPGAASWLGNRFEGESPASSC